MANSSTRSKKVATPVPSFKDDDNSVNTQMTVEVPTTAAVPTTTAVSTTAAVPTTAAVSTTAAVPTTVTTPDTSNINININIDGTVNESPIDRLFVEADKKLNDITTMRNQLKDMETFLKNFVKEARRVMKAAEKVSSRRQRRVQTGATKVPSGFAKKARINETFKSFLETADVQKIISDIKVDESKKESSSFETLDADGKISRPSATKIMNAYIKSKNLQDPEARKNFKPDAKLKKLLTPLSPEDTLKGGYSYFNLQRYTSHLYIKETTN